jgi:hypothetical protein
MYDYYLGGTDNLPIDREAAEQAVLAFPNVGTVARQNRAFMARTVRYLTGTAGITQFLDIGTGIPTAPNLHQVAQAVIPGARVVYVDNDPEVLECAKPTSTPEGRAAFLDGDVRQVESLLALPALRETIDLSQPLALSMHALLHLIPDEQDAYGIVRELVDALPSGSYLSITQATADYDPDAERFGDVYRSRGIAFQFRSRAEVSRFFDGLELEQPGVQVVHRWRPDPGTGTEFTDAQVSIYGGLARKP